MSIERMAAWGGSELVDDTVERTNTEIVSFYVREDTVIDICLSEGSPATFDYKTIMNLNGKTLKQGDAYYMKMGEFIQRFKLTSGSVIVYR
jgi:hypothetical protein